MAIVKATVLLDPHTAGLYSMRSLGVWPKPDRDGTIVDESHLFDDGASVGGRLRLKVNVPYVARGNIQTRFPDAIILFENGREYDPEHPYRPR